MFGLLDFHKGCLSDTSKKINKEEILKLREITTCDYYFFASKLHLRNCNPKKNPLGEKAESKVDAEENKSSIQRFNSYNGLTK